MEVLSASETLYGFVGWLTTQDKSIIIGASHDAAIWAEKVDEFCKVNKLAEPGEGWAANLIHPSSEVAVAGRGKNVEVRWDHTSDRVVASYKSDKRVDSATDKEILHQAKSDGLEWYAEGYNFITGVRDICFDKGA